MLYRYRSVSNLTETFYSMLKIINKFMFNLLKFLFNYFNEMEKNMNIDIHIVEEILNTIKVCTS